MSLSGKFKSLFLIEDGGETTKKKLNKNLIILLVVGIGLLLFSSFFSTSVSDEYHPDPETVCEGISVPLEKSGSDLEKEIGNMLNKIRGVSNASVFLTLESSPELVLADISEGSERRTTEEDSGGGTRETVEETWKDGYVIMRDARDGEKPLVLFERKEQYRGVLVVAEGVEDPRLKAQVVEALSSLLGIPTHRISVLPRGN